MTKAELLKALEGVQDDAVVLVGGGVSGYLAQNIGLIQYTDVGGFYCDKTKAVYVQISLL